MDYAVCIDIEGNFDLRHAAGSGSNTGQLEAAKSLIVLCKLALALKHMNFYAGLAVRRGGEDLALLGRNGGVAVDQAGEYAAHGLDAQRQRSYVQKQNVLYLAAQYAALDSSAYSYALIGVYALERILAGNGLNGFLYCGDTSGAADQNDLIYVGIG